MASISRASRRIYWDSCIFIAWVKNEKRPPGEMDGVFECVEKVEKNDVLLITSVMTRTEVFEAELPEDVRRKYEQLFNRRNVQTLDQDLRVSNLAREIREFYKKQHAVDGKGQIAAPDAVHLATAIHYQAEEFHTFDAGKRGGRGLLSLDGNVAGRILKVCRPPFTQLGMPWRQ